jgi:carbonic anhydrase
VAAVDGLLANNRTYAAGFNQGDLPRPPGKKVAVVACMDARIDIFRVLGLGLGDAHVIRNAGGVVTDDVIRSLVISQRLAGTRETILIHHTDCGMATFRDDEFKAQISAEVGIKPAFALEAFSSEVEDVRQSIARLRANPFILKKDLIRGFVFDVATGRLEESKPYAWQATPS